MKRVGIANVPPAADTETPRLWQLENAAFRVSVAEAAGGVFVKVEETAANGILADGNYYYHAVREGVKDKAYTLEHAAVTAEGTTIVIRGRLAGLDLEQTLSLPVNRPLLEEHIVLRNNGPSAVALKAFEAGFTLRVTDATGGILPELAGDRWAAVPFLRRADYGESRNLPSTDAFPLERDPRDIEYDFPLRTLLDQPGFEYIPQLDVMNFDPKRVASPHRFSDAWAWMRDKGTVGVFSFNQEYMVFSTVTSHDSQSGKFLRFGGSCLLETTLSALRSVAPGQSVDLGVTRFQPVEGGYNETAYAYRAMLDENGCRFPADYNPPVHWEQYYEMSIIPGDRDNVYTRAALEEQAAKGVEFSCEALYLDPGWDTSFGSFIWGPWLGEQKEFFDLLRTQYGLTAGLHFPMPPWVSPSEKYVSEWPEDCRRRPPGGFPSPIPKNQPWVCMGSRQYLDEAEKRILQSCEAGAVFLMFDGTWWNGLCVDESHGHPIPYRYEDHVRTCVELARRIHARYPRVLIEMHDMLTGGEWRRMTPVYYKYGLPGSYDENWGFELMWSSMKNLKEGTSDALYYYALGCNVPMYLHIRLDDDNEHALSLWWYASTCRHLGIGAKAKDPAVVKAHQEAMRQYRKWEEFYKRGEFYGISREIHFHVLPAKNAFTVNVFNLSGVKRTVGGSIDLKTLGLNPALKYISADGVGTVGNGRCQVRVELPPWGARVAEFCAPSRSLGRSRPVMQAKP